MFFDIATNSDVINEVKKLKGKYGQGLQRYINNNNNNNNNNITSMALKSSEAELRSATKQNQ